MTQLVNLHRRAPAGVGAAGKVLALSAILSLFGLAPLFLHRPDLLDGFRSLPWWTFAILFAVTEICVVNLRLRKQSHSLSLSEVPLVIGLFLAAPSSLLIGRLVGSLAVFLIYRRQTLRKAAFNSGLVLAGTAIAEVTFLAVLSGGDPLGFRGCLAALLAAAAGGLLEAGALLRAQSWHDGMIGKFGLVRVVLAVGEAALIGLIGVVPVLAFSRGEAAVPVAALGGIVLLGYRAFATLTDRHARLERLYELSDALAGAPGSADVVRSVLSQSTDLLRADYAEVLLAGVGTGVHLWSLRHGEQVYGPVEAGAHHLTLPFPPDTLRLVQGQGEAEIEFLAARGVSEAVIVPLRIDGPIAGHLLVGDRRGEERGFVPGDVRLLETVANHGSVALRNGRLIEQLHFEARHDELTGLPNRLNFRSLLDEAAEASRRGVPCAVMVLDFNGFKAINDSLGHQAGDELLRVLAARFRSVVGDQGTVARLGGDEFAIVSGAVDAEAAEQLAARVLATFEDPVPVSGTRLRVGGSLGIALGPLHGTTGADLLRKADVAMYVAKSAAGGRRMYSADMLIPAPEVFTLATDLRDAVQADEIEIVVHPLIDLESGQVHSFEALARWQHPVLGEISPEDFFAAAEQSGQVAALSERILDRALAAVRTWMDAGYPLRVAVNLAPRWLADPSLPDQIQAALTRHGVPADRLCLELTESSAMDEPRRAGEVMTRLRTMGVHLSMDDFGTGYSSLNFLSRLPIDQMKIDRSFVQQMYDSARDRAIVQSIIDLGRNLGLEVVAEGVTHPGARRALQEMGCQLAQGYLFTAPISLEEVPDLVSRAGTVGRITLVDAELRPVRPLPYRSVVRP
ncbi:MAG TPA: EAL domain-containing protein [Kineosporiaceae bacterium]|nr:EAL domain-containing protein [Kineosporiaceae bacterium]